MCGRFALDTSLSALRKYFALDSVDFEPAPNYNAAPSQTVAAVIQTDKRRLTGLRWGLIPFWAKTEDIGNRLINARGETLAEKPAFRAAFAKRRCLIPAGGFYEWEKQKGKKQPWYFFPQSGFPAAMAGLWETWTHPETGDALSTCAIITVKARGRVSPIHHRMPAVLFPSAFQAWLDPERPPPPEVLETNIITDFAGYPVSGRVNSPVNNDPDLLKPISPA